MAADEYTCVKGEKSVAIPIPPPPPVTNIKSWKATRKTAETPNSCLSSHIKDLSVQCRNIVLRTAGSAADKVEESDGVNLKWLVCNTEVEPKLQGGLPMCGLVALSMAANMVRSSQHGKPLVELSNKLVSSGHLCANADLDNNMEDVDGLLVHARERGFSIQGEMYCAENIAMLAMEYYEVQACVQCKGLDEYNPLLNHLAQGLPILVPYDADKNHEPYLARGHKAHWALVTGFLCRLEDTDTCIDWTSLEMDAQVPSLYYCTDLASWKNFTKIPLDGINAKHLYLLARQGKSRHTGVWSFADLRESNSNLCELDPQKQLCIEEFIVPAGGIKEGLSGKIVLISGKT